MTSLSCATSPRLSLTLPIVVASIAGLPYLRRRNYSFSNEKSLQSIAANEPQKNLPEKPPFLTKEIVSKEGREFNTHKYLTRTALHGILRIIREDPKLLEPTIAQEIKQFIAKHERQMINGSLEPDHRENDPILSISSPLGSLSIPTFAGHFYDPDSGKNFLGKDAPTALTRFQQHTREAWKAYFNNKETCATYLGYALHYLCDAGEPHHSSNQIVGRSNHGRFEMYASDIKQRINSAAIHLKPNQVAQPIKADHVFEYTDKLLQEIAQFSKQDAHIGNIDFQYNAIDLPDKLRTEITLQNLTEAEFKRISEAIIRNLSNCQNVAANFIFHFLQSAAICQRRKISLQEKQKTPERVLVGL